MEDKAFEKNEYIVKNTEYNQKGIPKIIHQTWKDQNIPEKWKLSKEEWIKNHPDWLYILWTDEDIINHIKTFHIDYYDFFLKLEYKIQMVDAIRYFILYDYGGVYCDLDLYPKKNIEKYITGNIDHFVYEAGVNNSIVNAFMISPGKTLLMREIFENLKNVEIPWFCFGKHLKVMYSTGPNFLFNTLLNTKYPFMVIPRKLFYPYSSSEDKIINENENEIVMYPIKNSSGSWHSYDSRIYAFINKYKSFFILIGILFLILLILFLFYYFFKYRKCKNSKEKCEQKCK